MQDWWSLLKDAGMYRAGHAVGDQFRKLPHAGLNPVEAMDPVTMMIIHSLAQQGLPFIPEMPVSSERTGKEEHSPFVVSQPLVKPLHQEWDLSQGREGAAFSAMPQTVKRLENTLAQRGELPSNFEEYKNLARTFGRGTHSANAMAALTNMKDLQPRNIGIQDDGSLAVFDPYSANDEKLGITSPTFGTGENNQQYKYNEHLSDSAGNIAEIGRRHEGTDVEVDFSKHFPMGLELLRTLHSNLPDPRELTQPWEANVKTDDERQQLQSMRDVMQNFRANMGQDVGFFQGMIDQPMDQQTRLGEFGGRMLGDIEGLQ